MKPLTLDEIMGMVKGATNVSPSSSPMPETSNQPFTLQELTDYAKSIAPKPVASPSAPTAYDELAMLQTKSTGLNAAVRGILQSGSNYAAAFGDFETAQSLDLTVQKYFAPEAPNFNENTGTFAYEAIASNAPDLALNLSLAAIPVVGIPLSIASIALPQYGESRKAIIEATGEDDPYAALAPAAVNTALDMAVPMRIARKLGLTNVLKGKFDEIKDNAALYLGKETLITAGLEGSTEIAQWATNLATTRFLTDTSVLERLNPQEQQEALNNFFGGVFGGAGFGLGAGAYSYYKRGEAKVAIEKEISDLDALLNDLAKQDAPQATQVGDPVQTVQPTTEAAIPPKEEGSSTPTAQPSPAKNDKETVINGLRYSLANTIQQLPKPLYDTTVEALQNRRQELTSLIGSMDTELNLKALSAPATAERLSFPNEHMMDKFGTGLMFNQFSDMLGNTVYQRTKTGAEVAYPKSAIAASEGSALGTVSAVTSNRNHTDKLFEAGDLVLNILSKIGMDTTVDGRSIKLLINDISDAPVINGEVSKGSVVSNGDTLLINLNLKDSSSLKTQYQVIFHELGHYVSTKIAVTNPDNITDALRAAYASFIRNGISKDKQRKATPAFNSYIENDIAEDDADSTYQTSFSEWLAEGFRQAIHNRVADGSLDLKTAAPNLFDKLNTALQRLYRISRRYVGSSETGIETFQTFVDRALAKKELVEVEAKLANMTASKAQELAKDEGKKELPKPEAEPLSSLIPSKFAKELANIVKTTRVGLFRGIDILRDIPQKELTWENYESMFVESPQLLDQFAFMDIHTAYKIWKDSSSPSKDFEVANLLTKIGMKKQAKNVTQLYEVNMGILGDNILGKFFRHVMTPIQIAEQATNRGFNLGSVYMGIVQKFQLMKTTVVEMADTTLKTWRQNGKESTDRVSKALYVISTRSDELKRRLTPDELDTIFTSLKLDAEDQKAWEAIDKSFQMVLDQMWDSTLLDIARTYNNDPRNRQRAKDFRDAYLAAQTQSEKNTLIEQYTGQPLIDADLNLHPMSQAIDSAWKAQENMRNKNYFPRSRMGEYVVRIKANQKGDEWEGHVAKNAGETLGFYAFDTEKEQKEFMEAIADETKGMRVLGHKLDSEVFSVMGLPAGIMDQIIRDLDSNPATKLSALQRELLNDIALQRSPGKRFLRHMTKRRGIAGYSEDAIRVYANYMSMVSNHLARSEYAPELSSVITQMNSEIQNPAADQAIVNDLNVLKDYFTRHFDYLMKPDNDWATLRSVGFLWYLGFNVKSAMVNLMQTPMVTLPVLSRHVGTAKAAGRLGTAMKDVVFHVKKRTNLSQDELSMLDYMLKANLIDESLVSELAGLGEAEVLQRLIPGMSAQSVLTKVSWYGGAMFRMGEKFNRYTTALASYRIARNDLKKSHEDAIQYSVEAIQGSQFEYAKFNRPELMRGKKSVIFLFWQYIQHASYLFFGGKGSRVAKRMWLMTLALAGLEGLPFAQFLMKLIDFGGTAVRDVFGVADPKVETNKMIRELILNIYDRPDDIMKGMSYQWGLGPFHLLRPLGVPVPNVTTEGSLGFGNPVPWFDGLMDPTIKDMDKALGQTTAALLGPIGGMVLGVIEALGYSKEEDNWKRWEKTLPVFMKNASQGIRWGVQAEETTSNGMQVVQFETPEHRAEIALKTIGFTPTRIDQTRRQMRASQEALLYHQARKQMLLDDYWYARQTGDREFLADARQAIREYNREVREAKLGQFIIKSDSLRTSLSERARARAMSERGMSSDRRQEALRRQAERLIPVTAKEEEK